MPSPRPAALLALTAALLVGAPLATSMARADDPKPAPTPPAQPSEKPADRPGEGRPAGDRAPGERAPGDRAPGEGDRPRRERGPGGPGGPGGNAQMLPGSLGQGMKLMGRSLKMLKDGVGDASKKDDNLRLVADFQRGCLGCKSASLERALSKADPAKRDELTATFRKGLIALLAKSTELETAVLEGRSADATRLIAEMIRMRDEGHKALGVRED
jgi:hypothetical protein